MKLLISFFENLPLKKYVTVKVTKPVSWEASPWNEFFSWLSDRVDHETEPYSEPPWLSFWLSSCMTWLSDWHDTLFLLRLWLLRQKEYFSSFTRETISDIDSKGNSFWTVHVRESTFMTGRGEQRVHESIRQVMERQHEQHERKHTHENDWNVFVLCSLMSNSLLVEWDFVVWNLHLLSSRLHHLLYNWLSCTAIFSWYSRDISLKRQRKREEKALSSKHDILDCLLREAGMKKRKDNENDWRCKMTNGSHASSSNHANCPLILGRVSWQRHNVKYICWMWKRHRRGCDDDNDTTKE